MNSNWDDKNNIKKKLKNEKKNHGVNFCAFEYYSHTCGLYIYI